MFKVVKCRGILLREMNKHTRGMASLSFFIATIPLIVISLLNPIGSTLCNISGIILFWYMISLFSLNKELGFDSIVHKIFTLPVWVSMKLSVLIFKFFLIRKYPEIDEEHYERWVKLQRIKRKISKN
jgi:hypothetical protein